MSAPAPERRTISALDVPAPVVAADALRLLHDRLPLDDRDRHDLDDPATERGFARLAAEHPEACTLADGWTPGGAR